MAQDQQEYRIPVSYREDEEIHLGPFFSNLKKTFFFLLRKWYVFLIGIAIFGGLGLLYAWWYGTKYVATATFAVEGQSAQSGLLSSAVSLANALGMQSSTSKSNVYNNNFFANLIQSRRVIKESLMETAVMNGKEDLLANHFITLMEWRKDWEGNERLKDFAFEKKETASFNRLEDSMMTAIYNIILDKNFEVTYDETAPFNTAAFTTRNYDFSRSMMIHLLNKSAGYYMNHVYKLNKQNLQVADLRVDSLGRELKKLDYRVASLRDQSNNTIRQKGLLDVNTAQRDQGLLSAQYSAAVNNVELAKVTLLTTAPVLQVIDDPAFSTSVSFIRKPFAFIVGAIIGFLLTGIYLVISRAVSESNRLLREQQEAARLTGSDTAAA